MIRLNWCVLKKSLWWPFKEKILFFKLVLLGIEFFHIRLDLFRLCFELCFGDRLLGVVVNIPEASICDEVHYVRLDFLFKGYTLYKKEKKAKNPPAPYRTASISGMMKRG